MALTDALTSVVNGTRRAQLRVDLNNKAPNMHERPQHQARLGEKAGLPLDLTVSADFPCLVVHPRFSAKYDRGVRDPAPYLQGG